ncbi:Ca2+-binding RTX toxin-like protein [Rhodovulum iodosum]|uniref:Ca2+-binding RTX toxin-like protein n=1 Tax=Rhodovulum iodosum TaxID=68291 RepID=A0ABV3XRU1_9RHOB|nr:calcium-binding protein [Rhodovulum robiginosum]RSK30386.1 calcium-binding protein [Rhodovulum robiginosum]
MVGFAHVATLATDPVAPDEAADAPGTVTGLADLDIVWSAAGPVLYAAALNVGGIAAFRIGAAGPAAALDAVPFGGGAARPVALDLLADDGRLLCIGRWPGQIGARALADDGRLGGFTALPLTGAEASPVEAVAIGGFLALRAQGAAQVTLYRAAEDGALGLTGRADAAADAATGWGGTLSALGAATAGGAHFLLAGVAGSDQILSYRVGSGGRLALADQTGLADGLGIATPSAIATLPGPDGARVVLGSAGSSTLTVLDLDATGALSARDHVADDLTTRFQGVTALETARCEGWDFVLAAGADDGISLFAVLPDGRLIHMASRADDAATGLQNVSALAAVAQGGGLQVFAASESEAGVTQLSVDLSGLGVVATGGSGAETVTGTAGDDILVAGSGDNRLRGGAGADLFVFAPGAETSSGRIGTILDYAPGQDRIDLSAFPLMHGLARLEVAATADGARLWLGESWLSVKSASGARLDADDFTDADVVNVTRHALANPEGIEADLPDPLAEEAAGTGEEAPPRAPTTPAGREGRVLTGTGGPDDLRGSDGGDTLFGAGGDDRLQGGGGDDALYGGDGCDLLNGGPGDDLIFGGVSAFDRRDTIHGGAGDDRIEAGHGNDLVYGMGGADTIAGGFGADELHGQDGDDTITGSACSDLVFGGNGDDFINGGFGFDRINGGAGADAFYHLGIADHGSDWVQDYSAADGDVLLFGQGAAAAVQFGVSLAETPRAGAPGVAEAFVIYRPTGQVIWALVDGGGEDHLTLQIAGSDATFDLV